MSSSILFPTNEYTASCKSSEEILRLMIPMFETIEETIAFIIAKGGPLQMPFVYRNFHKCCKLALSTVCSKAPSEDTDNQIQIAMSFEIALNNNETSFSNQELESIFEMCLQCLNNLHSQVNEHMGSLIENLIKHHRQNRKLIKRLEDSALELGKPSQPIISKVTSGRLISILAKYIGKMIKGEMIDILKRILADNEVEAKKVWISEIFPRLLQTLQLEFIELHLQQKIYESVYDENEEVRILALEVILRNVTKFSIEEQSSRIVKLFIDSLTSKNEKVALMSSSLIGQVYQKLQNIILRNQNNCVRFWRSVIEIAQSKNDKILNNLIYNLPGLLVLSNPIYKVEPVCDVYIELFYQQASNKAVLVSYFHEIGQLFPAKNTDLRDIIYWMFNEIFEDQDPANQAIWVINKFIANLHLSKSVFLKDLSNSKQNQEECNTKDKDMLCGERYFQLTFCEYLARYLNLLLLRKNGPSLLTYYTAVRKCFEYFAPEFVEQTLLPKLYSALRMKTAYMELVVEIIMLLLTKDLNSNSLVNTYASKINIELSKSNRSYERQAAIQFFYYASFHFSIDLFQEFKLGEKFLNFNNQKCFKNKVLFVKYLPRMIYFFSREQKIENAIILARLAKDPNEEIVKIMESQDFQQNEEMRQDIAAQSKRLKEKERQRLASAVNGRKLQLSSNRRESKEINKQEILKKRVETKSKTKLLSKQIAKRKATFNFGKISYNVNFRKNS